MKTKKIFLILVVTLLLTSSIATLSVVKASTGGPDSFGYTFIDSNSIGGPTYNWIEISGTGTMILPSSDDSYVSNIPMGFFFNFYGNDYSQVAISNNGILFTNTGSGQYGNQPIGQSSIHGFIAPWWDDIVTWNNAGDIYYQTLGTAPHRTFVVEWQDNQHYSSSPSGVTFEAIMYEGTNNILFQYQDTTFGTGDDNGAGATVGIERPEGDFGLQYSYNQGVLTPGLAILYKFPAFQGTNMYLTMRGPASLDNGHRMTYTISYNNFGGDAAANVEIQTTLSPDVVFVTSANQEATADQGTYDSVNHKVTWNLGTLLSFPNGRGSVSVTVDIPETVPVGTVVTSSSTTSTSTLEIRYDDNSAAVSTTVTGTNLPPNVDVGPLNGNSGTTPTVYWGTPITFAWTDTLYGTIQQAFAVDINIHINDGGADIFAGMSGPSSTGEWTYTVTFYPRHGQATVTYTPHRPDMVATPIQFSIYIDPAGYIYNTITSARIEGATVWLQRPDGAGGWENVPTGESPPISDPDTNPLITNVNGQYEWLTLPGTYRVHVEAVGYEPADSIAVTVPPPVFDLNVGLTPSPSSDVTPPVTTLTVGDPKVDVSGTTYINSNTALTLSAVDADTGVLSTSYTISSATYNSGELTYSVPFYLSGLADGLYTITYSSLDNAANSETPLTATLALDNTAPQTSNDYVNAWHASDVTVTLTPADSGCGVAATFYTVNGGDTKNLAVDGQPIITAEGASNIINFWSTDALGTPENIQSVTVKLDKTAPAGTITINNGSTLTNSKTVNLKLTATDSLSGVGKIRLSNDGVWDTEQWENPATAKAWNMTSSDGVKTVYYQVQDQATLTSATYSATIRLDATAPTIDNFQITAVLDSNIVNLVAAASDNYGAVSYSWDCGDGKTETAQTISHAYSRYGTFAITLTVTDLAGNTATKSASAAFVPKMPIIISPTPSTSPSPTQTPTVTPSPAPTTEPTTTPAPTDTTTTETETPLWIVIGVVVAIFVAVIASVLVLSSKGKLHL